MLLIVNADTRQMVFYDFITAEWYECTKQCPMIPRFTHIIDGKDDYLYFLNYVGNTRAMFKIDLLDIIPNEICAAYKDTIYEKLIFGFVREAEKKLDRHYTIPVYINQWILSHYPMFLHC